jgi:hypothetical protein
VPQTIPYQGFVGSAYGPQSRNIDKQILENWYLEVSESQYAKKPTGLLPCPGFDIFCTLPNSPVRGLFSQNDRTFAIGGEYLYEIARDSSDPDTGVITARAMTTLATPSAPTITNSPLTPALAAPNTPVVTHGGTLGATTYGYKVTAINALGQTTGSTEGTSTLGNATLSATNYNLITWDRVTDATGYKIYRTTGPDSGKLIGSVGSLILQFIDIGTAGTAASPPGANTTGGVAGATTYGYKVVARLGLGTTAASAEGLTNTGQATLSDDDYNTITWPAVPNAHSYDVYRTTGAVSPPRFLGTTTEVTFDDTGEEGESLTPPTADTTGTSTIEDDGSPVFVCSSGDAGNQLLILSAGDAYLLDLETNRLAKVLEGATSAGYIGGYFVVLDAATSTLKSSELLDGFEWDASQVYQRTSAGDRWLAMGVSDEEIWLFGSDQTDVWRATGDDETRFAPYSGITIPHGILAPQSLCRVAGTWMWVGQNRNGGGLVYRTEGYAARPVSTHGLARQVSGFSALADATAWSYQQEQHEFYIVSFPSDAVTWGYDITTNEWHARPYWNATTGETEAYRAQCHTFAFGGLGFGLHLVGDRSTGVVAKMSPDYGSDIDGAAIRRTRQAPHLFKDHVRITYYRLELDVERGLGLSSGQGSDPTAMLSYSNDGGDTFGRPRWKSAGAQGARKITVAWDQLGSSDDRVFKLVVTDPIPWRIGGATLTIDPGAH